MSRIGEKFNELKKKREGALVGFLTAGDPSLDATVDLVLSMVEGGVDLVELGIPFSDPIADGTTIQASSYRALKAGTNVSKVFDLCSMVNSQADVPIILLTYLNPVYRMGMERFIKEASRKDVDGLIIPDMPVEEAYDYKMLASSYGIDTIFLASPTTSEERLSKIARMSSGFLYVVSLLGVTGARERLQEFAFRTLSRVKALNSNLPTVVGFGISRPEHVASLVSSGADGVVVGSALVKIVENNLNDLENAMHELKSFIRNLKHKTIIRSF